MSEDDFDARLRHIEDQAAARQERVDGYRDQHLARLFVESDWSHEKLAARLAKEWGKEVTRQWVGQRLRFGRFLSFFATGCSEDWRVPPNLTEGAFRRFWDATEAGANFSGHKANTQAAVQDERRRFAEIVEELKHAVLKRAPKPVRKAIIDKIGGQGQWLSAADIRDLIAGEFEEPVHTHDVISCLNGSLKPGPNCPYRVEVMGPKEARKYRVVKVKGRPVSRKEVARWSHELIPMLEDLIREAHKERVAISLTHLCAVAGKIKKVMEALVAQVPDEV